MYFTLDTSQRERSALNELQPSNIYDMSVTLDTSQRERSALNNGKFLNNDLMPVTLDTSHSSTVPYTSWCQLPVRVQSSTAARMLSLFKGRKSTLIGFIVGNSGSGSRATCGGGKFGARSMRGTGGAGGAFSAGPCDANRDPIE